MAKHPVANQEAAPSGMQFNLVPLKDLARGLDLRSAESNVADGYCEDLANVDTISNGQLAKRVGYQGYAGYVPMRVRQVSHDGFQINLKVSSSIDLTGIAPSPVVLYGKFDHAESGDISSTAAVTTYESFSVDVRDVFSASSTTATKPATDTGVSSSHLFVDASFSTSETDASNYSVLLDSVTVDSATYQVIATYVPPATERAYITVVDKATVAGTSYVADYSGAAITLSGGLITGAISAATHGLGNFNVIPEIYSLSATTYTKLWPDLFTIDSTTGDVAFSWTDTGNFTGQVILASTSASQYAQQSVAASSTGTIVISTLTTNFPYYALYRLNGSLYELVIPESVVVDATAGTMTVTIVNASLSPEAYAFYYDFSAISAGTIRLVDSTSTSTSYTGTTISNPQLTLWGISHANRYLSTATRGGHVLHLDSYKRDAEARLVSGLGGNFFASRTRSEVGTAYSMPQLFSSLTSRVSTNVSMAPLFQTTGASATIRTRGIITGDDVAGGYAVVTGAAYVSAGVADYTLSLVGKVGTLTLSTQIATSDYLTVLGMGRTIHNGTFAVLSVPAQTSSSVTIRVTNAAVQTADFDETGSAGKANVFTDQFAVTTSANYIAGDLIQAASITDALVVTSMSGTTVNVSGVTATQALASGLNVFGSRTNYVQPLKTSANVASVTGLVRGDMVTLSTLTRQPRVVYINPFQDMSIAITVAGTTASVTLGGAKTISSINTGTDTITATAHGMATNDPVLITSTGGLPTGLRSDTVYFFKKTDADSGQLMGKESGTVIHLATAGTGTLSLTRPHNLSVGQRITIAQTGDALLEGVVTVLSAPTRGTFTYATTSVTASATGVMVGRTVELDESILMADALSAPTSLTVTSRWIPIEAPTSTSTLPATTHLNYLTDASTTVRSCMVASNMYSTNYTDSVMKFDGTNIYQAGLFRWQPTLFAQIDTTTGSLTLDQMSTLPAVAAGNKFTIPVGEGVQYSPGDRIVYSYDSAVYTIQSVQTGVSAAVSDFIYVFETISGFSGTPTVKPAKTYRYYARLNAIDANNNIIASAVTGSKDMIVEITAACQVRWRFVGMPVWGVYDYDRIELQLYRTIGNTTGPYYLVSDTFIPFSGQSYIDVYDNKNDDALRLKGSIGDDSTMIALKGAELGTGWEQPPRAKYLCSAANCLVLGNIKDYQQLDIVLRRKSSNDPLTAANLAGLTFLLRKDSSDTGTTTNMVDRATYEFVNSGAVSITPNTDIAATSTTFVVTKVAHGLVVGNWVYMYQSAAGTSKQLRFAGWWQIAAKTADTFTINFANSYTSAATDCNRYIAATIPTNIPVFLGTDGNYSAVKYGNTSTLSYQDIAAVRLANAINASMVAADTSVTGQSTFVPWVTANAGSEYQGGQVIVRVPKYSSTTLKLTLGTIGSTYEVYVHNTKRATAGSVSASSAIFPSRAVISYPNYPEMFDSPMAAVSDSIVDVNSADGEEITGMIPFFGESAFSSSQVESLVVVFKTNSIYLLDVTKKTVQKIDSQGLGCTAPLTIAPTRSGIMFANLSGVYRLGRDLKVSYVGKFVERYWKGTVNADQLALATGHNYGVGRQYKLSVPVGTSSKNSVVLVYDYTREQAAYANADESFGAWVRYTNHAATGWCNLNSDSFFATSDGQVFKIRRALDSTDYRDDASAVDEMVVLIKSIDGGLPGVRKVCRALITHLRMEKSSATGTRIYAATENSSTFTLVGTITKTLGDKKVITFRSSLPTSRFVYLSIKFTNTTKDEEFILAGVDFLMAVLGTQGVVERSEMT